jgi:hypothetical protein
MKHNKYAFSLLGLIGLIILMSAARAVIAQEPQIFSKEEVEKAKTEAKNPQKPGPDAARFQSGMVECLGPISRVVDVAYEGIKFTPADYTQSPGGGESGRFDRTPVLSTRVSLANNTCLDAHFSALVASKQTFNVAPLAFFQVTLTKLPVGVPHRMIGHLNLASPAVMFEPERVVDMYASNFFQRVATGSQVPPGVYQVDVWWAGSGPGGALGADFVLKLYLR